MCISSPQRAWPTCTYIFLVLVQPSMSWCPLVEGAPAQSPQVGSTGAMQASPEHSFLCQDKEYMYTEIYTKLRFQRCFINQVSVPRETSSPRGIPREAQSPGEGAPGVLRLSHLPLGSCRERLGQNWGRARICPPCSQPQAPLSISCRAWGCLLSQGEWRCRSGPYDPRLPGLDHLSPLI